MPLNAAILLGDEIAGWEKRREGAAAPDRLLESGTAARDGRRDACAACKHDVHRNVWHGFPLALRDKFVGHLHPAGEQAWAQG